MKKNVVVPEIGEAVTKGTITAWLKKSGDVVNEGEGVFELETEKATVAVPSQAPGRLEILVQAGAEVAVGQTVGTVDITGESVTPPPASPAPVTAKQPSAPVSPSARRIVEEKNVDVSRVTGTGKGGLVTKGDALAASAKTPERPLTAPQIAAPTPPLSQGSGQKRVAMTPLRRRTAERLVRARQESVHVTTFNEIDMSKVMAIRSHLQEAFEKEHGIKIGFMSFFVKACCKALTVHPEINAQVDGADIVYNNDHHIGVAVSMDRGLIVPVIRNADKLTFAEIEAAVADKARRARDKRLLPDELVGGTFTITNGGVFGSLMSTPVPAFPQSAILGMHAIKKRPVVVDDAMVIRPMMYVALTYDHRIVDGRDAIGFLVKIKDFIEEPEKLLLEM